MCAQSPSYLPYWRSSLSLPFHNSAVKYGKKIHGGHKKRYKYIGWVDLALAIDNQSLTEMIQQMQPNESFNVFLFSYSDLIEGSASLLELMR